eukprot:GHRR01028118.1.p2 GENE.GHRR01028118.1~~GHRR01028118.1.p2  ORF type:complete len:102 (+),score=40.04 GHRR01028118.1:472-777(+)
MLHCTHTCKLDADMQLHLILSMPPNKCDHKVITMRLACFAASTIAAAKQHAKTWLIVQGVQLEHRYGSGAFALLLAELLVLSHSMFVALAVLAAEYVPEFG